MEIKEIAELIEIIEQSAIEEFELEKSGVRIRIKKGGSSGPVPVPPALPRPAEGSAVPVLHQQLEEPNQQPDESLFIFRAPIVGTFYITPKPDADPFVSIGDRVTKGTVLCIIEAMKIFNQIDADVDGEIVRILVENGQPVEYGEALFEIRLHS